MKQVISRFKPFLRWLILGGTLFFLAKVLKDNWQQIAAIRVSATGWACLTIALGVTLLAHICAGWVWSGILRNFKQPVPEIGMIQGYLKATIAKYLPGNVWHYYGRITAATGGGASLGAATLSVLLEPLLMAASALIVTLLCSQQIVAHYGASALVLQWVALGGVLVCIHPRVLNPVIQRLATVKQKSTDAAASTPFKLERYPLAALLGELGFLVLRTTGFLLTFLAISPIAPTDLPLLLSAFSLAWLLGLVVPGAPGGVGVFEATAIALLGQTFAPAIVLGVVALYRLISVLAEAAGAGLAWLDGRQ